MYLHSRVVSVIASLRINQYNITLNNIRAYGCFRPIEAIGVESTKVQNDTEVIITK